MLDLLVVQPTPFCNLNCDYCYLPQRNLTARISENTLKRVFAQVLNGPYAGESLTVVWHAGEPLVMPRAFYESAIALAQDANGSGVRLRHSLQTNATLIDPEWCALFRKHDIGVGISIDGPASIHDRHRKTRAGKGTHDTVMRGIRCLQQHDVPFHVISVLTREALDEPEAFFEFYAANHIREVGFNVEEVEGVNQTSSLDAGDVQAKLARFLDTFLDLAASSTAPLQVREVTGFWSLLEGRGFLERNQENAPLRILSVDWAGNFSTFSPELLGMKSDVYGSFILGNVATDDIAAVEGTLRFRHLAEDVAAGVAACAQSCEYFAVCGGGSPANKYFENGSFRSTETMHCRLTKKVFTDVMLARAEAAVGIQRPVV
jgi:uncharacterized protein